MRVLAYFKGGHMTKNGRFIRCYAIMFALLIVATFWLVKSEQLVDRLQAENDEIKQLNNELLQENLELYNRNEILIEQIEKIEQESEEYIQSIIGQFEVTAYDLSIQCCGKRPSHPQYGITASGKSLEGLTRKEAMAVAVDPSVIPLGSKIRLEFDKSEYMVYNGVYTAVDTGSAIKGNVIDLFMGDFESVKPNQKTINFGRVNAVAFME